VARVALASQVRMSAHTDDSSFIYLFIHSFIHQWFYSRLLGPGLFSTFVIIFYTDGRTPWTSDQPVTRPLPIHRITQIQNKRTQTSMSRLGFEPTIPASERVKTVDALDRAATVMLILAFPGN
jgi:hypothetical protein